MKKELYVGMYSDARHALFLEYLKTISTPSQS